MTTSATRPGRGAKPSLPVALHPSAQTLEGARAVIAALEDALRQARLRADIAEARARRFEEVLRFVQAQLQGGRAHSLPGSSRQAGSQPAHRMPPWAPAAAALGAALLILLFIRV